MDLNFKAELEMACFIDIQIHIETVQCVITKYRDYKQFKTKSWPKIYFVENLKTEWIVLFFTYLLWN